MYFGVANVSGCLREREREHDWVCLCGNIDGFHLAHDGWERAFGLGLDTTRVVLNEWFTSASRNDD